MEGEGVRGTPAGQEKITPDQAARLFLEELETIERVIRFACRRSRMSRDEVDDFASHVKLKLIDGEYAIIRKHDGQSSFAAFLSVVIQRLLIDYRIAQWGKWHCSAEARRLGDTAVTIEAMILRDGRSVEEVLPALQRRWPELTRRAVEDVIRRLPARVPRARFVDVDLASNRIGSTEESVGDDAFAADRLALSRRIAAIIATTLRDLDESDRLLFRLRFEAGMSVAEIARTLHIEQKPLYRRVRYSLRELRRRLEEGGITIADATEVLNSRHADLSFTFESALPTGHVGGVRIVGDEEVT